MPDASPPAIRRPGSPFLRWLRRSLVSGVAIVVPFAVPIWLGIVFVNFLDNNLIPLLPPAFRQSASNFPGAGIAVAFVLVLAVGALAANIVGRFILREAEDIIRRLPVFSSVYGGVKLLFGHIAERRSFKDAVLIEYPGPGAWSIGFITGDESNEIAPGLVAVYVPFAPIPTSGFVIYAERQRLRPIEAGAEVALMRVLSFGASAPIETPPAPNGD